MVWDLLLGAMFSSFAGLTLALITALVTDHRENRRWLQTKVHQPMYGELNAVISGETPWAPDEYVSRWAELDYYKTYRVDVELAEALDRYASAVSELARCEQAEDVDAFVEALTDDLCEGGEGVARLPSGRSMDVREWLRRNALVLAADPSLAAEAVGVAPADLEYLWAEVDGVTADGGTESFDTGGALAAVSTEFNWGYEGFYRHWDDGWVDAVVDAFLEAARRPDGTLRERLRRRRALGEVASEAKGLIEARTERGLFRSLWHAWFRT